MPEILLHTPLIDSSCKHEYKHTHTHNHNHDARKMDKKILLISLIMTFSMMIVQFIYALLLNSLALLSDTLHMFSDVFALSMSLLAIFAIQKLHNKEKSFGYFRLEILVAFINSLTIIVSAIYIIYEAIIKFLYPVSIDAKSLMIIALIGLLVNAINAFMMLRGANLKNINMKSAFLHMLSDLLGSLFVCIGGVIVYFTNFVYIDTILALILSLLLLRWAIILLKESVNVLLEASPINTKEVEKKILSHREVSEILDLHISQITYKMLIATMYLRVHIKSLDEFETLAKELSRELLHDFEIGHCTIQPLRSKNEI
ncbi:cation diffusion facilitator family transporter [Campylobacter sp. LR286c]|uniref:cation diffusion facilitator family transporter n=1 Tax=Campylobacter sp. LR286c TaxID=2593545 RepID=UPI0012380E96|nr:cation diffusion facilitator family transporter [Campylobacter sp. LR286c]KAA6226318.1 cation transporter [Campylobacter sp. LR286c]